MGRPGSTQRPVAGPGGGDDALGALLRRLAARAAASADGTPENWLLGYVAALADAAVSGRGLTAGELAQVEDAGAQAAHGGRDLADLVGLYLRATQVVWDALAEIAPLSAGHGGPLDLTAAGAAALRASEGAVTAAAAGFDAARGLLARQEETAHREFVDDLLEGRGEPGALAARAEHVGLDLAASHVVAVARTGTPVTAASAAPSRVEDRVRAALPRRRVLVTTKDGMLVVVLADSPVAGVERGRSDAVLTGPGAPRLLGDVLRRRPGAVSAEPVEAWRVGVGRPRAGPGGVARSYRDAVEALELAGRLDLPDPVVLAEQLLVYRVLLRDQPAMADLVTAVLSPLTAARGGAEPLLETLSAYYASGGVAVEAARRLHLSVRAVTYRLERVRQLTGYDAASPDDRLALEIAVVGARLLEWPARRLPVG